ncbi:hypothetical protein [Shivajiella indica]|uniref:Uncharacterized protein n=1 Tax=Shivajiella indica TaxID=872115 RepID=A0ABW5BF31_9BACT
MKPRINFTIPQLVLQTKFSFFSLFFFAFGFIACSNSTDSATVQNEENFSNPLPQEQNWLTDLMQKDLLTDETYLQMIPQEIIGYPLLNSRPYPGLKGVYAVYSSSEDPDDPHIILQVIDGAGHHQFQHVNAVYKMLQLDLNENSEELSASTKDYKGMRILVKSMNKNNQNKISSEIEFIKSNRYHVTLTGNVLDLDGLYLALEYLDEYVFPS